MDWSRVSTCEILWSFYQLPRVVYTAVSRWCYKQSLLLPDVDLLCISLSVSSIVGGGQSELSGSCTIGDALLLLSPSLSDFWCHSDFSSQTVIFPASVIHLMSFRTECLCGSPATIFVTLWFQHAKCQKKFFFLSILTAVNSLRIKHRGNLAFKKLHLKM